MTLLITFGKQPANKSLGKTMLQHSGRAYPIIGISPSQGIVPFNTLGAEENFYRQPKKQCSDQEITLNPGA